MWLNNYKFNIWLSFPAPFDDFVLLEDAVKMNLLMTKLAIRKIIKDNKTMIINPFVPDKIVDSLPFDSSEFVDISITVNNCY